MSRYLVFSVVLYLLGAPAAYAAMTAAEREEAIDTALSERHRVAPCGWWKTLGRETVDVLKARFDAEPRVWRRVRIAEVQRCFAAGDTKALRAAIDNDASAAVRSASKTSEAIMATQSNAKVGTVQVAPRPR